MIVHALKNLIKFQITLEDLVIIIYIKYIFCEKIMFKIDQVKNLFDCEQCYQLLVDPVTLLCGYSVCKRHIDELLESNSKESNTFLCKLCDDEHCIPKKGFAINKSIQSALDIKLNTLKLNPVYEECKSEINYAKNNIQKIENLEKDPENYSFEYFEELKRQGVEVET